MNKCELIAENTANILDLIPINDARFALKGDFIRAVLEMIYAQGRVDGYEMAGKTIKEALK